jgi:hypothetical protein
MRTILTMAALLGWVGLVGCASGPTGRLNAPPQGSSAYPHRLQEPYLQMTDSAVVADMSVADIHFVPHTPELNDLGQWRLAGCVDVLKRHGGTVRYDSQTDDAGLVRKRLASIREYLEHAGVDPATVKVVVDVAGGRGIDAQEAIDVLKASRTKEAGAAVSTPGP